MGADNLMFVNSPEHCHVVGTPVSCGLETFQDRHMPLEQILHWLA
jgi:hypothetical protein